MIFFFPTSVTSGNPFYFGFCLRLLCVFQKLFVDTFCPVLYNKAMKTEAMYICPDTIT